MNATPDSMEAPFDATAADHVRHQAIELLHQVIPAPGARDANGAPADMPAPDTHPTMPLVLAVRAPGNDYGQVMDECWVRIKALAEAVRAPVSDYDTRLDSESGQIRIDATPNLALALVMEDDLFWSVAADESVSRAA